MIQKEIGPNIVRIFLPNGRETLDKISQSPITGDCHFVSSLEGLLEKALTNNPEALQDLNRLYHHNADGSATITIQHESYQITDKDRQNWGFHSANTDSQAFKDTEIGFAKYRQAYQLGLDNRTEFSAIDGDGRKGAVDRNLAQLTGWKSGRISTSDESTPLANNADLKKKANQFLDDLLKHPNQRIVGVETINNNDENSMSTTPGNILYKYHVYEFVNESPDGKYITLHNPWGDNTQPGGNNVTIQREELLKNIAAIGYVEMPEQDR